MPVRVAGRAAQPSITPARNVSSSFSVATALLNEAAGDPKSGHCRGCCLRHQIVALATGPANMRIEANTAVVNGQRIHYLRAGAGPALVLVHGYPESSLTWLKVIPELAKKFSVIAPDTRGTGQSSLADNFSLEDVADDVYELVKLIGFTKV